MAAQLLHDVGEALLEQDVDAAGAGQVNAAFDKDATGPRAHDKHCIGQEHGFAQVMGDKDGCEGAFGMKVADDLPKLLSREGVEGAEGLVQHQKFGGVDQRATKRGALLHAAGELPGVFRALAGEPDGGKQRVCRRTVPCAVAAKAAAMRFDDLQRQQDVVAGQPPWQHNGVLERHASDRNRARHGRIRDADFAGGWEGEAGGEFHQGGFAAARGPDDGNEGAFLDPEIETLDSKRAFFGPLRAIAQCDVLDFDKCHRFNGRSAPLRPGAPARPPRPPPHGGRAAAAQST